MKQLHLPSMAHTQDALACEMVRNQFGDIAAETVRILLAAPGSTLSQVVAKASSFCDGIGIKGGTKEALRARHDLIRDTVAVLIQHAVAHTVSRIIPRSKQPKREDDISDEGVPASKLKGVPSSVLQIYYIRTENILFRMRLPLYLGFSRRRYGDVGEAAIRAYFERGRLTTHQVFTAVLDPLLSKLDISVADAEACLNDMAKSGLMQWSGKRSVGIPGANSDDEDDDLPIASTERVGKKRIRTSDFVSDYGNRACMNGLGQEKESIHVGRSHHRLVVGAPTRANDQDIWGICFFHLNREFRNECCALVVHGRVNNELSLRILRAGLQIALDEEDCESPTDDFETIDVGTHTIQMQLEADQDGAIRDHEFWEAVQILIQQTPSFVVGIPENAPTKLRFIPGQLVSDARQKTLEDLVASRYGMVGRRVFRALAITGGMEEKMLAEKCMLPLKVAREHLFRMYQDRMVSMQEVPRSHDQQRASNWYYLWKVNPMSVYRAMIEIMYKTILNLFLRLQCVERAQASTAAEKKEKALRTELIMGSILRMDQSVMVMRDFGPVTPVYLPALYAVVDGPIGKRGKRR